MIEVREVTSRAALAEFVDFPYRKYRDASVLGAAAYG